MPRRKAPVATVPAKYAKILRLIPGYDPIATAEDCEFKPALAERVTDFFSECLRFIEGDKGGQPFETQPWQKAILWNIFGWIRPDGSRRYREAFIYIGRKNGKTPLLAGIVLYGLFCEEEPGNQIYSAAGDRDQASLIYRHAKGMMLAEPELGARGEIYETSRTIVKKDSFCKYQALSSDAPTKHGLNASMIVVDELHAQPNHHLVDTLITSVASRRQPLVLYITTADFDRPSICNEKLAYAHKVQQGLKDFAFLPVIYETDREADWTKPKVWAQANPNLGISVSLEYMQRECKRAMETPSYQNTFKRLHLNMQTSQDVRWLDLGEWDACHDATLTMESLEGKRCFAGLDLASTSDLCALGLWFPDELAILCWFWLPEEAAQARWEHSRVPYPLWIEQGYITTTPGNVTDYDFVRQDILEIVSRYDLKELAIDRWNSTQLQTQLAREGLSIVQYAQTPKVLSAPTKELERLVMSKRLRHTGNQVTRWCISNVTLESDHEGNVKPSKERSNEKIDAVIALAMAMGRAMTQPIKKRSVYETRGLQHV